MDVKQTNRDLIARERARKRMAHLWAVCQVKPEVVKCPLRVKVITGTLGYLAIKRAMQGIRTRS